MTIEINSENKNQKKRIELTKINKIARAVLGMMGKKNSEINIVFFTSQKIRVYNRKYFGIDLATDVIAFPAGKAITSGHGFSPSVEDGRGQEFLGDIAISTDRAKYNAGIYGTSFQEETALYVIHGILHLLGYEDTTEKKRKIMRGKENECLQEIRRLL
ncbi:MAG: rRNA maturation RNase YbeY [Candidatus Omnitrophica bacterium]|nr:rRNA maturation RNase YbeY [Candidatus Omnitrophota bacterium]